MFLTTSPPHFRLLQYLVWIFQFGTNWELWWKVPYFFPGKFRGHSYDRFQKKVGNKKISCLLFSPTKIFCFLAWLFLPQEKPLKVPSLARSVPKPLKVKPCVGEAGGLQTRLYYCFRPPTSWSSSAMYEVRLSKVIVGSEVRVPTPQS